MTGAVARRGRRRYELAHAWRDQRLASDWPGLLAQVRVWQTRASLHWGDADIVEVARDLDNTIYRFERPLAERERSC